MIQLPNDFIDKYIQLLEADSQSFFDSFNKQAHKAYRINPLKPNFKEAWQQFGPKQPTPVPYSHWGYYGQLDGKTPLHQAGYGYSQEPSAMAVATTVDAQTDEIILDLCAAPGGKSTQIASQLNQTGLLVANEVHPKRAKILSENMERWGSRNVIVTQETPTKLADAWPSFFDKVLVDAPCSGEGMFRKNPQTINQWDINIPHINQCRQIDILQSADRLLKPGGELIYSTCTFAPEENEQITDWLIDELNYELLPLSLPETNPGVWQWGHHEALKHTCRIWPHLHPGEGHFIAKLRKKLGETNQINTPLYQNKNRLTKEQENYWDTFKNRFNIQWSGQLSVFGHQLWLIPKVAPNLEGIKWIRPGLALGTFLKNRFQPDYGLALAIDDIESTPHLSISHQQWRDLMTGLTLKISGDAGWVLLVYEDLIPVAFGKQTKGTVKNFIPKGLRF